MAGIFQYFFLCSIAPMDFDEDEGGYHRKYRYGRKHRAYPRSVAELKRSKKEVFGYKGVRAFYQKRHLLLAGGGTPDSPEFGVLEATVRFGVSYTKKTLREIATATLKKLVHEFGNQVYEVRFSCLQLAVYAADC